MTGGLPGPLVIAHFVSSARGPTRGRPAALSPLPFEPLKRMQAFSQPLRRNQPTRFAIALLSTAVLALGACNSDSTEPASAVVSVAVTPRLNNLIVGGTQQLAAQALDASGNPIAGKSITWTSSEPNVATVSASGLVTTVGPGSTAIQASADNSSGFAAISVSAPVSTVVITGNGGVIPVGTTQQLTANLRDAAGNSLYIRTVTWTSSAPTVATVSSSGLLTAVAAGTATISATSEGRTGTAPVTTAVTFPVATVTLSPAIANLVTGTAQQLTATLRDGSGSALADRAITWTTSNAAVATVSSTGLVTTIGSGTATITAASEGKSGTSVIWSLFGLSNTITATIQAPINASAYAWVTVPAGTTRLVVSSSGGTGDPDMYLYRPGATPATRGTPVCASEADGPIESCTITAPAAGLWLLEMFAYAAFSGVTVRVVTTP